MRTTVTLMVHDALSLVVSFRRGMPRRVPTSLLSGAVDLDGVQQLPVECLPLVPDGADTSAPDQVHQRSDVAGAAPVEVVGEVFSQHADAFVTENEALLDGR